MKQEAPGDLPSAITPGPKVASKKISPSGTTLLVLRKELRSIMPAQSRSLSTRFMTLAYDWESLVVIALGRSRKGNLFSVADILWGKKIQLFVGLSMPLSLVELAWLDIWPGQAWLAILSCLVWICQMMVIACSVPVSIPSQFHFHPVSIHPISMPIPISASVPIPAPWSLRFLLSLSLLLPGRCGFCAHGLAWAGLARGEGQAVAAFLPRLSERRFR